MSTTQEPQATNLLAEDDAIVSLGVNGVDDYRADIQLSSAQNQRPLNDPNLDLIEQSGNSG